METHFFDENQPQGSMSLANVRNTFRGLHQGDFRHLRPSTQMVLDDFEYPANSLAQTEWSGTGVTVSASTTKQEGNFALQCEIDGTGNREVSKTESIDLSAFLNLLVWNRCSASSSAIQLYLRDSSGNESYWDITTHSTADTWQQDSLTLATPDSNNGSDADLSDITEWGFSGLDASTTYLFDTIKAVVGKAVVVYGYDRSGYHQNVYLKQDAPLSFTTKASPEISVPTSNPRIDILLSDKNGNLSWRLGSESSEPDLPYIPQGKFPIVAVYCKTTMTKVVEYSDKDANPNEAYLYKDLRPLWVFNTGSKIQDNDGDSRIETDEGNDDNDEILFITEDTLRAKINASGLKLQDGVQVHEFSSDATLSDNSDTAIPTEKAVKQFVESKIVLPEHFLTGFEFQYVSGSDFKVTPGVIELEGARQKSTSDIQVTGITNSANYFEGSAVSGEDWVYVYLKASGSSVEVKLSLTPPDLADTAENTAGIKRYRKVSGIFYRCIFAMRTNSSSQILKMLHSGAECQLEAGLSLANGNDISALLPSISCIGDFVLSVSSSSTGSRYAKIRRNSGMTYIQLVFNATELNSELSTIAHIHIDSDGLVDTQYTGGASVKMLGWVLNLR